MTEHDYSLEKALPKASRESAFLKDKLMARYNVINAATESICGHVSDRKVVGVPVSALAEPSEVSEFSEPITEMKEPSLRDTAYVAPTVMYSSERDAYLDAARAGVEDAFNA